MNWFEKDYPNYVPDHIIDPLVEQSRKNDQQILSSLGLQYDWENYDKRIGYNNAHDYLMPTLYPMPARNKINRVLDFGAGYGRQANLWAGNCETYVSIDAIECSYCLQSLYYSAMPLRVKELFGSPR